MGSAPIDNNRLLQYEKTLRSVAKLVSELKNVKTAKTKNENVYHYGLLCLDLSKMLKGPARRLEGIGEAVGVLAEVLLLLLGEHFPWGFVLATAVVVVSVQIVKKENR